MSRVFVDTSAILALLNPDDRAHALARRAFQRLQAAEAALVTHSYVLVETYALLGRRFGLEAVAAFREEFAPLLETLWVEGALHEAALDLLADRGDRSLSLVDATSLLVVQRAGLDRVFAYDRHFTREGFDAV